MVYVSGQENDLDSPLKAQVNSLRSPSLRSPSPTLRLLERSQELRRGCRDTMRVGSSKERELPPSPVQTHSHHQPVQMLMPLLGIHRSTHTRA